LTVIFPELIKGVVFPAPFPNFQKAPLLEKDLAKPLFSKREKRLASVLFATHHRENRHNKLFFFRFRSSIQKNNSVEPNKTATAQFQIFAPKPVNCPQRRFKGVLHKKAPCSKMCSQAQALRVLLFFHFFPIKIFCKKNSQ